MQYFTTV